MNGINEKDSWLIHSVAHKILCARYDPIAFAVKLRDLKNANQSRFEKLFGICARLEFIEQLRHTLSLAVSPKNLQAALYQLDRLVTYLTTTCIDIATGERYQAYHEWLQQAYGVNSLGDNWKAAIEELNEAEGDLEIAELFIKWTSRIYEEDYQEKTSIRRAFKGFVCDMPNWFRKWLFKEYIIEYSDNPFALRKREWGKLTDEEKCKRIAFYLYDLRNLYTHTVIHYQPMDSTQRFARRTNGIDGYVSILFPPLSPKGKHRTVILRIGFDESDIVRLLVVAWLRRNWLDIQDDESFIQRYLDRTDYRRLGFEFLLELKYNLKLVEEWCSNHLYAHSLNRSYLSESKLEDTAAKKFIAKHEAVYHHTLGRIPINTYLASIERINLKIAEFNAQCADYDWRIKAREMDTLFSEIIKLPEARQLIRCIERIRQYLFPTLDVPYHYHYH